MFHKKSRSSLGGRKVTPPEPTCMTPQQKFNYLDNLRNHRPARPGGSRPAPFVSRNYAIPDAALRPTHPRGSADSVPSDRQHDDTTSLSHTRPSSAVPPVPGSSAPSLSTKGRPLARPPVDDRPVVRGRKVSPAATVQLPALPAEEPGSESLMRRIEKEEAHDLREALEFIDHKDQERRIYEAAQHEAADLVWQHQNAAAPTVDTSAPYANPDALPKATRRVSSGRHHPGGTRKVSFPNPTSRIFEENEANHGPIVPRTETPSNEMPLRVKSRNTLPWLKKKDVKAASTPHREAGRYDQVEIHRNSPSRSHDAGYVANTPPRHSTVDALVDQPTVGTPPTLEIRSDDIRAATSMKRKDRSPNLPLPTAVSDQLGRPIVSFDRTWTLPKGPRDESCDAPQEQTGRPAVTTPAGRLLDELPHGPTGPIGPLPTLHITDEDAIADRKVGPVVTVSPPTIPTIAFPEDDVPAVPAICVQDCESDSLSSIRPPHGARAGPVVSQMHTTQPAHGQMASVVASPPSSRSALLSRTPAATVSCSSCALPISGRIVTASASSSTNLNARFHPECFTCFHCSTPLECVSFYPEPDEKRWARLESMGIEDRMSPALVNDPLRFYCHLDFHEFFSPRCRSCKTPIEGQVIVAAGAEWHVGHFFCAECGEPFDSNTPFVERDNYAYCVSCHTKRTSARCRECKQFILDELTVEALGGKYHERCFVCFECGGGFGDDGRFFVRDIDVRPTEKEMRRGIDRKLEEKAVCASCEERRLKA